MATGLMIGAAGLAIFYRSMARRDGASTPDVTYSPVDTLKPLADSIWIVDSGPISAAGLKLPVRMAVVRLTSGDLLLHSPTRYSPELAREIAALGPVRHLIAPTTAHWSFLKEWQLANPQAVTWAVPGLRHRAQVRRSGTRIDRELSHEAPQEWAEDIAQGLVPGEAGFCEAYFYHKPGRALLLADLIENLEPEKLPVVSRAVMSLLGATRETTARHVRAVLKRRREETASSIRTMLALEPDRVIFAHGRAFDEDGAERLRRAFAWLDT